MSNSSAPLRSNASSTSIIKRRLFVWKFYFDKKETKKVEGCRKYMRSLVAGCVFKSDVSHVAVCEYKKNCKGSFTQNAFLHLEMQDAEE